MIIKDILWFKYLYIRLGQFIYRINALVVRLRIRKWGINRNNVPASLECTGNFLLSLFLSFPYTESSSHLRPEGCSLKVIFIYTYNCNSILDVYELQLHELRVTIIAWTTLLYPHVRSTLKKKGREKKREKKVKFQTAVPWVLNQSDRVQMMRWIKGQTPWAADELLSDKFDSLWNIQPCTRNMPRNNNVQAFSFDDQPFFSKKILIDTFSNKPLDLRERFRAEWKPKQN